MRKEKSFLKSLLNTCFVIFVLTSSILLARSVSVFTDRWIGIEGEHQLFSGGGIEPSKAFAAPSYRPSFVEIVEKEKPAVVNISSTSAPKGPTQRGHSPFQKNDPFQDFFERFYKDRQMPPDHNFPKKSLGSGFIISPDGYILTNNHVVEKADEITVTLSNETEYKAKLIGTDPKTDIALIKIDAKEDLPVVMMGDSDSLKIGEWVIAIGNPFGYEQSVTAGIVSGKKRVIGAGPYDDFIQTDASINPGNSGGPLINTEGKVIGINTAIFTAGGRGNIGIGFAVPINIAKSIIQDLKEKGVVTRGWLGVMIQKVTPEISKGFGLKENHGALVGEVISKSPAAEAGLKRGDIIIQFAGKPIKSVEDLPLIVATTKPDTVVSIVFIRDGKEQKTEVKTGTLSDDGKSASGDPEKNLLGISVQDLTPEIRRQLNLGTLKGVYISWIGSQGPAQEAGVRRGQVILEINRTEVSSKSNFDAVASKLKEGDVVTLVVRDDRGTRYVGFTLKEKK